MLINWLALYQRFRQVGSIRVATGLRRWCGTRFSIRNRQRSLGRSRSADSSQTYRGSRSKVIRRRIHVDLTDSSAHTTRESRMIEKRDRIECSPSTNDGVLLGSLLAQNTRESGIVQTSTTVSANLRILVACRPVILDQVLANVLSSVPEFLVVGPSSRPADVVITTCDDATNLFDDLVDYPPPNKLLIAIDRHQNTLYVRRSGQENVGIKILPGELPVLLDLLNREATKQQLLLMDGRSA